MLAMVAAISLIAAQPAALMPQQAALHTIPDRWLGEWNEDLEACGTGNSDSRLRIYPDHIRFYESGGLVRGVFENGSLEILIVADMSGEGQTWLGTAHFRMASDGRYITTVDDGETLFVRYRCPPATDSSRSGDQ